MALRAKLPRSQWIGLNKTLVSFGQKLCLPVSPWCSRCPVEEWCPRLGSRAEPLTATMPARRPVRLAFERPQPFPLVEQAAVDAR